MSGVLDYISRLLGGLAFWVVVLPWQQALRVRAGRHVSLLKQGIYLKLPVLDVIQVESVRRRSSMVPTQTLSTANGVTVTVSAVVQYSIRDLELLYRGLHHAEDTIAQMAQGVIAEEVFRQQRQDIDPGHLRELLTGKIAEALAPYGLGDVELHITDFAFVRAIRLVQDQRWFHGQALDTSGVRKP